MNHFSLIANSGIQFFKKEITIDPNDDDDDNPIRGLRFHERFDSQYSTVELEYAHFLKAQDIWVSKKSLAEAGYVDAKGKVFKEDEVNTNVVTQVKQGEDAYSINSIEESLDSFENKWLPLPYFEEDNAGDHEFGSTGWCRLKLIPKTKAGAIRKYMAVLVFDTKTKEESYDNKYPILHQNDEPKAFSLCSDENQLLDYCSKEKDCAWVDEYIAEVVHGGIKYIPDNYPSMKYLANYIFLIYYLQKKAIFPKVTLYSNKNVDNIDVDLVLDIGNSQTCGLLVELQEGQSPFNNVKKLELQNLSELQNSSNDPFSMRLTFHEANFGEMGFDDEQFVWPSILRVGEEANRIIYLSKNDSLEQKDKITNYSSPKRYLWDHKKSSDQWEFNMLEETNPMTTIYLKGVSEQFNSDGTFSATNVGFGVDSAYSRKSLMTFVFLEIMAHAHAQINSHEFREDSIRCPRRLRRIIISCPTAMSAQEQFTLRQCASEASIVLRRFIKDEYNMEYHSHTDQMKVEIVPPLSDLKLQIPDYKDKREWGYDEATCCQLVFIYAEISKRYLNHCSEYFDLYGKFRNDLPEYDKKSLTIGSIDIGAGTTDLMICAYQYNDGGKAVITPVPLFWESFYYAGDDLLKEIIKEVILEGEIKNENYRGCVGVIQNFMTEKGMSGIPKKLNSFFGEDNNRMNSKARQVRRDFNVQISIPIALHYLELTRTKNQDVLLKFEDFFPNHRPNQQLLDYFEKHFGFRFEEIIWKFTIQRVNDIIVSVFENLLTKISGILHAHGCDFVLLSGRPTSLHQIEELFYKLYPTSPDRIISLNKYRVGMWYPFQDGNGYFENQKSIVAVGAMIGYYGGASDKLGNFRLNMDQMKWKLFSTAKHFGIYDHLIKYIKTSLLSPEANRSTLTIAGVPTILGCKQLGIASYPSRPLYVFDFNRAYIKEMVKKNSGIDEPVLLQFEVERYIRNLQSGMPLKVKVIRQYRIDREVLELDSILDSNREELSPSFFSLSLRTIPDETGYWLDTGEFILSVSNKNLN